MLVSGEGGWGDPPRSWYYPCSTACWSGNAGHSMCGRTTSIWGKVRGIALSSVVSSHPIPGVSLLSGWPTVNSSLFLAQSCACSGGVLSWNTRWAQLHTPGMVSAVRVSLGTSLLPPCTSATWPSPTSTPIPSEEANQDIHSMMYPVGFSWVDHAIFGIENSQAPPNGLSKTVMIHPLVLYRHGHPCSYDIVHHYVEYCRGHEKAGMQKPFCLSTTYWQSQKISNSPHIQGLAPYPYSVMRRRSRSTAS